jgi:hypothetical protein
MAKKVNIVGTHPKRVRVVDKPRRRIEPAELAAALGAEPCGERIGANLEPISLAELGTELLRRLRSSGGRPALADATEYCRVPLSAEDVKALEKITEHIEQKTGTKPSLGQVVSVILRDYLTHRSGRSREAGIAASLANKDNEPADSMTSWLPRLAEIASEASTVQKSASAIETAVKQIKQHIKKSSTFGSATDAG